MLLKNEKSFETFKFIGRVKMSVGVNFCVSRVIKRYFLIYKRKNKY